jgi:phage-related minor tail protein
VFPFASGIGLMGEAGPEAIMPLTRASNGDLGVKVVDDNKASSPTVNINFQVNAIDTQSAMGVIMANKSAIIGMVQGAFNKAGRVAPMIA